MIAQANCSLDSKVQTQTHEAYTFHHNRHSHFGYIFIKITSYKTAHSRKALMPPLSVRRGKRCSEGLPQVPPSTEGGRARGEDVK